VNAMVGKRLDLSRLMRDAHKAQAVRPESAIGRETTGLTRAVREQLPAIRKLREEKVTWAAIAAAITKQGVTQGDGRPLTATRLTAVVGHVERQIHRKLDAVARRGLRPDLARSDTHASKTVPRGLVAETESFDLSHHPTEEALRRASLDELRSLLGKD
jgi:hypothetical protein